MCRFLIPLLALPFLGVAQEKRTEVYRVNNGVKEIAPTYIIQQPTPVMTQEQFNTQLEIHNPYNILGIPQN